MFISLKSKDFSDLIRKSTTVLTALFPLFLHPSFLSIYNPKVGLQQFSMLLSLMLFFLVPYVNYSVVLPPFDTIWVRLNKSAKHLSIWDSLPRISSASKFTPHFKCLQPLSFITVKAQLTAIMQHAPHKDLDETFP